jgi:single-strand DNA-binding protein
MNETIVTLTGRVATEVDHRTSARGVHIASFRLAANARRSDRDQALFVTVTCWRQLAENVAGSLSRGHPVVVTGRLRMRSRELDKGRLAWAEVDAHAVGHDLSQGTAAFRASARSAEPDSTGEQEILDDMAAKLADQFEEAPGGETAPATSARAPDPGGDTEMAGSAQPRADAA